MQFSHSPDPGESWVIVHRTSQYAVVTPLGDLFTDTCGPLREALKTFMHNPHPRAVLNLSSVNICGSSGLNLMIHSQQTAAERGGWVRLVLVQPLVRRVLETTGLTGVLPAYTTVAEAVADLSPHLARPAMVWREPGSGPARDC